MTTIPAFLLSLAVLTLCAPGTAQSAGQSAAAGDPAPAEAVLRPGVKLFTDRDYALQEMPDAVRGLPFFRTGIERLDAEVAKAGTLFAVTPTIRPRASSQEEALREAGFTRVEAPEAQFFPGEVNRVSLYRKAVKRGERFHFRKMVLFAMDGGAQVRAIDPGAPWVLADPGAEFQDEARPGAMIVGMDRTPKGRIWACWTGTGDKKDGYFLLATSDDGGGTWSKPRLAVGARADAGQRLYGALVGNLWTDPLGRLWLFFDQQIGDPQGRITNWYIRCDDPDAAEPAWTQPVQFAEGCTLCKPTVLKNGDWLLPVSDWHKKTARVFVSTDQGRTWTGRGSTVFPGWNFDEHMMVELRDGRLWMLARTETQPYECFSTDLGATWSEPRQAATVQNVNARFFLRRLASGRILLVKNGPPTERLQRRSHMSAYLSDDEGATWKGGLLLDERASVSYPDGFEAPDGLIHILYDWNRHTDAEILLAKFREEDVLAGKIVSKDAKLLMPANKATGPKPERLYNGIELPLPWPPPFLDPTSTEPMPVPYLERPPKTIPIDVGRQLFVDNFLVESTTLRRTYHQAVKFEGNPVLRAETERELGASTQGEAGEQAALFTGQGGIFWDPAARHFKLYHVAGWRGPLSLATSTDMVHWARQGPLLPEGLRWSGPKLATGGSDNCVWLDLNATNPAGRVKYLTCWMHVPKEQRPPGFNHSLQMSDGATWSDAVPTTIVADDYCSFFFNPFRGKWCFSIKKGTSRGRSRFYAESDDFLRGADWSKAVYWTNADRLDAPEPEGRYPGAGDAPQLYSLNAVAYESLMVGMHYIHRGPDNRVCAAGKFPKLIDLELGFSRDGFHWQRPDRRGFITGARAEGAWDRAYLHGAAGVMVVLDDTLVFPYAGFSGQAPGGHRGMYTGGSIGLAMLRRDGFASMDAGDKEGALTTRPLKFKGKHLYVNLQAPEGELRAEVLDENNQVVAPFTAAACKPLQGDTTRQRVTWQGADSLAPVRGKPVKFRFLLRNGSLYSFWVTADANGASHGYVGAGGPAFDGVCDAPR
jgi:predicted neuraminidase